MSVPKAARHVVVTGAGSGIGRAIAYRLAKSGDHVVGTVRDPGRAAALTAEAGRDRLDLLIRPLDLEIEAQIAALVSEIERSGGVDVLVNNAGFGAFGAIEEVDPETVRRQFSANVFGPLQLTRACLPSLRARRGRIIWIGSLAGRLALPFQAHYSATKAAVAALSDALRLELASFGVAVTCVEPGDFATGFTDARVVAGVPDSPYRAQRVRCLSAVNEQERNGPDPEWVARVVERISRQPHPPARCPVGRWARTLGALERVIPYGVREPVLKRLYRL
jgi:NAD(P)-dependent dehydrogenase (short-subunit alcohol dehydrogenase family)